LKQQRGLEGVTLGNGLLDKDNIKKIQQKWMSKKLTWLTHKHLLESFFMDLIVNSPEGSEL
jgi:hypothetical protein